MVLSLSAPYVTGDANVILASQQALINISSVLVWGLIPVPDDANWQVINTTQPDGWALIFTNQGVTWNNINTGNTTWTDIDDSQPGDGNWTNIPN
jgi:hypothetical protein